MLQALRMKFPWQNRLCGHSLHARSLNSIERSTLFLLALTPLLLTFCVTAFAQATGGTSGAVSPPAAPPPTAHIVKSWRAGMAHVPLPRKGCFTAAYPSAEWQEIPCRTAPQLPYPPVHGHPPLSDTVGNGTDASAQVAGTLSEAVGSFDSVTGVTSESGYENGSPPLVANIFSLQLNSNFFTSSACSGATNPSNCKGWQQFVYSNTYGLAYIQYWLINYNATCPSGWIGYSNDCYTNSNAVAVPVQTISNLANLSLTGQAVSGGMDTLTVSTGTHVYSQQNQDSVLGLAQGWGTAEFNIFGDCCGTQATFNSGATLVVRTSVDNGTPNAPSCSGSGTTGETNNLSFVATSTPAQESLPAIVFTESGTGTAISPCSSAIPVASNSSYALSVSVTGSGTVTSAPAGISCGATCSANFASGTAVTLTPAAAAGYVFTGWGGACSGSGACVVTMSAAQTVSATFTGGGGSAPRTFVSAQSGSDSNPCTRMLPCRTVAAALVLTRAGGEIEALDPGGYGPVTINGPLQLVGIPGAAINAPANGIGITINAGISDTVEINNFQITSDGVSNATGIAVNSGNLMLRNSALKFLATGLTVTNTKASLFNVDIVGNTTGIVASGTGPNTSVNPVTGPTEVLLFFGSASNNTTAYFMQDPGTTTPNILAFLSNNGAYSTSMAGNGTLVDGSGAGCPCNSLGTFSGGTNPN